MKYASHFNPKETPQTEQADPRQEKNSAGGYSFTVDPWQRLRRFLILGTEGGTYYISERKLTRDGAQSVLQCLREDPIRALSEIAEISHQGRAPKNDPAIFALALATSSDNYETRALALTQLPNVCRTGTHLFQFLDAVTQMRGWSRGLRNAVARWFESRPDQALMYQLVKYRQRAGWKHRDALRLAHPKKLAQGAARWAVGAPMERREVKGRKPYEAVTLPEYLEAFEELQQLGPKFPALKSSGQVRRDVIRLIEKYRFTFEMLPTEWLNEPAVWEALLPDMPMTAMVRNLGRLSAIGLLKDMSETCKLVCSKFTEEHIRKARLHPLSVLVALKIYAQGRGEKGSLTWDPARQVIDALDEAFYTSFGTVEPTGKATMLALDVSGSMTTAISGLPVSCRQASAAMAMVVARTEPNWICMGFGHRFVELKISPRQRLDDVVRAISGLDFQMTDCALPMQYAKQNKLAIDVFQVYTDSETYYGGIHPHQALKQYSPEAKLAVVGMTANPFTIADPTDPNMLDVVGFDTATPNLLAEFAKGL